MATQIPPHKLEIALVGNPNSGKTSIFNALTGLRFTTANYPGVTVEKRVGVLITENLNPLIHVLDLPGTYSLLPRSLDEQVVHNVLLDLQEGTDVPDLVVVVVDANNMERNLYLATQVIETGLPVVVALNMWDLAKSNGIHIDVKALEKALCVPCLPAIAIDKENMAQFKRFLVGYVTTEPSQRKPSAYHVAFAESVEEKIADIAKVLDEKTKISVNALRGEAIRLLGTNHFEGVSTLHRNLRPHLEALVERAREELKQKGIDAFSVEAERRYAEIDRICQSALSKSKNKDATLSEKIDKILTHRIWGLLFFMGLMGIIFQSIFSWAQGPISWIRQGIDFIGSWAMRLLPEGQLRSLVVDGAIAGVGNVLVFIPQIFLLFFFISLVEDFGYMARAAFVLDRIMKRVGLNGKAFLPLLSSFACAIPGVMATRTIEDRNDRLATILVAPLMSCSARIPVYVLMIGAFIPSIPILGGFNLQGLTLFSMYFLSIFAGLSMASIFRGTFLKGNKTPFVFELPPYRLPNFKSVFITMWDRGKEFLYRAGSIIFCISIILWFLASYPRNSEITQKYDHLRQEAKTTLADTALNDRLVSLHHAQAGETLRASYAGMLGKAIEPFIQPLGFDWKIGVGLVASFAAREVLVSTLAIVYNIGDDADENSVDLIQAMRQDVSTESGKPVFTPLVAVSLMVFFVLACQCMSTLAIVKKETNSWRWPLFMLTYMTVLAWAGSFAVYQGGRWLGFQ